MSHTLGTDYHSEDCDVSDLMSYSESISVAKSCANIPSVDFGTFSPLLGTKFFCFNPSDFGAVSDEINAYLKCDSSSVNFDFEEKNHQWKCNETINLETATFNISLFQDSTKNKIFVKFHRLSGSPAIFSASVERFTRMSYVLHEVMVVDPTDMTETSIQQTCVAESPRKRKGSFKALPLPLNIRQKPVSSTEFVSYCDIFNIWAQSDVQECLSSIHSSMPKMWKDLTLFYKTVEGKPAMGAEACTAELIVMFQAINKIYRNLCTIAIQAFQALQNADPHLYKLSAIMDNVTVSAPVAAAPIAAVPPPVVDYFADSGSANYDFLEELEDGQIDGSAGYADDFHFGAHAAANNMAHRQTVTMDVTRSSYRSMAVFEQHDSYTTSSASTSSSSVSEVRFEQHGTKFAHTESSATHVFTIDLNKKSSEAATSPLLAKVLTAATAIPGAVAGQCVQSETSQQFADLLSQRSKEDLSKVLQLSMACICHQMCSTSVAQSNADSSFDVRRYLAHLLKDNCDFMAVTREIAPGAALGRDHSFEAHNSKDIALLAQQLLMSAV